jgi:predicted nuclease of restriction endonuclease-like RecB superfamily
MLTKNLLRVSTRGPDLKPGYVRVDSPTLREAAQQLLDLWQTAVDERWRRGEIEETLGEWFG